MTIGRLALAAAIAALVAAYFALDLRHYVSLDTFKSQQAAIDTCHRAQPIRTAAVYFLIYVAMTGLSLPDETEASARGIACEVTTYGIEDLDRAIADGEAHGLVKVLTVPGKDRILGATIVGDHAGDLIIEFIIAMKNGIGLEKILGTIHIYPTLVEANKHAAGAWKRNHAPRKLLAWIEKYHSWRLGWRLPCAFWNTIGA